MHLLYFTHLRLLKNLLLILPVSIILLGFSKSAGKTDPPLSQGEITLEKLEKMPKIDAHAHIYPLPDEEVAKFIPVLEKHNFSWITIATEGLRWHELKGQIDIAADLHARYPQRVAWITFFNLQNWGSPDWEKEAIRTIEEGFSKGALGVKVYKEIGMELKDPDGRFVMIDDPRFDPLFRYVGKKGKTVAAHIGEPRNCWLPFDSMTVEGDREYFRSHPKFHAYQHPEIPGYWAQIAARDHVLEKFPNLRIVGCHLGSLEFDVDEIARRLEKYPNFAVDMAGRVCHFQLQTREKVCNFMIKYQDRLLYGTDLMVGPYEGPFNIDKACANMDQVYHDDYRYFATDEEMESPDFPGKFRGLALHADVLKKIFHDNAVKWYPGL